MSTVLILAALSVISVALIVYALLPKKGDDQETVRRRMAGKKDDPDLATLRMQARDSVAKKVVEKVSPLAIKPVMPQSDAEMSKLRIKLSTAGFRSERAPTFFLSSKTLLGIGFGAVALLVCYAKNMDTSHLFGYSVFAAGLAFMAPNVWLSLAASRRSEQVRNGLPDGLDLMVISVEAGLGLDAAIQRVGDEMQNVHPVLSEEFQIASWETQMGIPRSEALDNLSTRTGVAEMRSLVGIVNQAEKFGTSIARALRNQSDAMRVRRRQAAEEAAQKTTVKLMAPLILCIFPAIFVVLAGPAVINLLDKWVNNPNL
jgi:tight adherence protein C